jgi:hypothetical protein
MRKNAAINAYHFIGKNSQLISNELINIKNKFISKLENKLDEADKNGKKLLIVMGEAHNTQHSYLFELMISTILKIHNFNNLMIEQSSVPLNDNLYSIYPYVARQVLKYNLIPINSKSANPEIRNEAINKNIASTPNEHSLCQVGADHLKHILACEEIKQKFIIFPIDLTIPAQQLVITEGLENPINYGSIDQSLYNMYTINSIEGLASEKL